MDIDPDFLIKIGARLTSIEKRISILDKRITLEGLEREQLLHLFAKNDPRTSEEFREFSEETYKNLEKVIQTVWDSIDLLQAPDPDVEDEYECPDTFEETWEKIKEYQKTLPDEGPKPP